MLIKAGGNPQALVISESLADPNMYSEHFPKRGRTFQMHESLQLRAVCS